MKILGIAALILASSTIATYARDAAPRTLPDEEIVRQIIQESRQEYYATGHPCACPDDTTRNGRSCGNMSALYSPRRRSPTLLPEGRDERNGRSLQEEVVMRLLIIVAVLRAPSF